MRLPCYQFWDVRMAAEEKKKKKSKKALPSNMISCTIQGCLITSRLDKKQKLIHMLMEMGRTNRLTFGAEWEEWKRHLCFLPPHQSQKDNVFLMQLCEKNRVFDCGSAARKSIQWNSGILMRARGYKTGFGQVCIITAEYQRGDPGIFTYAITHPFLFRALREFQISLCCTLKNYNI